MAVELDGMRAATLAADGVEHVAPHRAGGRIEPLPSHDGALAPSGIRVGR